jgi:hypothetical protein
MVFTPGIEWRMEDVDLLAPTKSCTLTIFFQTGALEALQDGIFPTKP